MKGEPSTEWLMSVPNIRPSRRKNRFPLSIRPPRMPCCNRQPPACECPKESR